MERRKRARWLSAAPLAGLLLTGMQPATCARAAASVQPAVAVDSLEPAKAAIRVKDFNGAARMLSELAARENAEAQYLLGTLILADLVPQADRGRAMQLFESAARSGQARAAHALAAMLAAGDPPDPVAARRWLARAAELGDPVARELMRDGALPLAVRPQDSLTDEASRRLELWRAARRDDIATLEILATAERVNAGDDFGRTALHHAADGGATAAIALLLERGAKVEATDEFGVTPLMLACAVDPPGACARLLQARASVTAADHAGSTAIAYATRSGRGEQARALQAAGSAPVRSTVNAASPGPTDRVPRAKLDAYEGWPDVVVAASRKDPTRLRELLDHGADPDAAAPDGRTALLAAIASQSTQAATLLLDAGADASRADGRGTTPLGLAVRLGNSGLVDALLLHKVNPDSHSARERPPLLVAVAGDDPRSVRRLLEAGADANARGSTGATALMISAARDQADIVGLLLGAGASPSATDTSGRSALWYAACADSTATVPMLLKAGATTDGADDAGVTPLACAAARGHTGVVDRLLRAGAAVSARTRAGDTPLMLAAAAGHADTVRRLLTAGADANLQNRLGDTALILASLSGNVETVQALLNGGASRKLRNRDGVAASDAAKARSFDGVVALLER